MNERIQELAKQADNYAYKMNPEQDSYGRSANPRKFQQDRDAKFAELIVGKCIAQCEQFLDDPDFTIGAMRCAIQLNQYFGVEE